jgi:hypothetical protein
LKKNKKENFTLGVIPLICGVIGIFRPGKDPGKV